MEIMGNKQLLHLTVHLLWCPGFFYEMTGVYSFFAMEIHASIKFVEYLPTEV
jgi:hypothetical protein